jgi:hypothetical protein
MRWNRAAPSNAVVDHDAGFLRAVGATVERAPRFNTMPDDSAVAVRARWRERMNGALEAVENVRLPGVNDLEGLVVVVSADLALTHGNLLAAADQAPR